MFEAGQVLRDTYIDGKLGRGGVVLRGVRQIRLIAREEDGRWLTQTIVDNHGATIENGRRTRVSEKTLATGYAPVED